MAVPHSFPRSLPPSFPTGSPLLCLAPGAAGARSKNKGQGWGGFSLHLRGSPAPGSAGGGTEPVAAPLPRGAPPSPPQRGQGGGGRAGSGGGGGGLVSVMLARASPLRGEASPRGWGRPRAPNGSQRSRTAAVTPPPPPPPALCMGHPQRRALHRCGPGPPPRLLCPPGRGCPEGRLGGRAATLPPAPPGRWAVSPAKPASAGSKRLNSPSPADHHHPRLPFLSQDPPGSARAGRCTERPPVRAVAGGLAPVLVGDRKALGSRWRWQ